MSISVAGCRISSTSNTRSGRPTEYDKRREGKRHAKCDRARCTASQRDQAGHNKVPLNPNLSTEEDLIRYVRSGVGGHGCPSVRAWARHPAQAAYNQGHMQSEDHTTWKAAFWGDGFVGLVQGRHPLWYAWMRRDDNKEPKAHIFQIIVEPGWPLHPQSQTSFGFPSGPTNLSDGTSQCPAHTSYTKVSVRRTLRTSSSSQSAKEQKRFSPLALILSSYHKPSSRTHHALQDFSLGCAISADPFRLAYRHLITSCVSLRRHYLAVLFTLLFRRLLSSRAQQRSDAPWPDALLYASHTAQIGSNSDGVAVFSDLVGAVVLAICVYHLTKVRKLNLAHHTYSSNTVSAPQSETTTPPTWAH